LIRQLIFHPIIRIAELHTEIAARLSAVGTYDYIRFSVLFMCDFQAQDAATAEKKKSIARFHIFLNANCKVFFPNLEQSKAIPLTFVLLQLVNPKTAAGL
jgi:hypothetical protein